MSANIVTALLLTAGAGLATTIGSFIGLAVQKPGPRFMGFTLGFSAGVMILVSFVELLQQSIQSIGFMPAHVGFFTGMITYFLIDTLVPHEYVGEGHPTPQRSGSDNLMRTGLLVALGIGIHNFPEGMATFVGALKDVRLGTAIAVAIAVHNIPEGVAVSVPVYLATGSRKKAFLWSFLSGVSEPLGAALAALFLMPFLTVQVFGYVLASVAGIMTAISIDELIPAAKAYGSKRMPMLGLMAGMLIMALSLHLLGS